MRVVRLPKTYRVNQKPVVKILPEIRDLFQIRDMRKELARDRDLAQVGHFTPTGERVRRLARLEINFKQQYGHAPDIRKLG